MTGIYPKTNSSIIISLAVHAAVLLPLAGLPAPSTPAQRKDLSVDYVIVRKDPARQDPAKDAEVIMPDSPRVDLRPKTDGLTQPEVREADADRDKAPDDESALRQVKVSAEAARLRTEARAKATKDYINYYQVIREKIRQRVRRRYVDRSGEGEVRLNFVLRSDGSIERSSADGGPSGGKLTSVALASLRDAAPFPRFPKDLTLPSMSFTVIVVFKPDR